LWKPKEAFDGTYDASDLMDAHEILDWQEENRERAREAAEK
jgi:hypothetical protein